MTTIILHRRILGLVPRGQYHQFQGESDIRFKHSPPQYRGDYTFFTDLIPQKGVKKVVNMPI